MGREKRWLRGAAAAWTARGERGEELAWGRFDGGRQLGEGLVRVHPPRALDGGFDLVGDGRETAVEELQEVGALLRREVPDGVDDVGGESQADRLAAHLEKALAHGLEGERAGGGAGLAAEEGAPAPGRLR